MSRSNNLRSAGSRRRGILSDQRGVAAFMFLASSVGFIGMAGFGIEVSTWYLERRHGQNAADAAAIAGALAVANRTDPGAAGLAVASANGYSTTGLNPEATITTGSFTGPGCSSGCTAVVAKIVREEPRLFSALLPVVLSTGCTHSPCIKVAEVAKAATITTMNACALSLAGGSMTISGSASLTNCSLASNTTIRFNGTGQVPLTGGTTTSAGACTSNGSNNPCGLVFQPVVADPFATQLATATVPPEAGSVTACQNMLPFPATKTQTKALAYENSGKMFCTLKFGSGKNATQFSGDLNINSSSIDFSPGTYVFYDASITISGGAVTCTDCKPGGAGVTFILTGDAPGNIGSLKISGGTVTLNAPGTPTTCTITAPGCSPGNVFASNAFKGLLFYMDKSADGSNGKGSAPVSITANSTVSLTGGLYFPSVNATYTGNANANDCTELVAKQVDFAGNASVDQCSKLGTQTAQVKSVQLVQ